MATTSTLSIEPIEPLPEPIIEILEIKYDSCVTGVRTRVPSLPRGDAKDLLINTLVPSAGIVVKFDYDHIAYIEGTKKDETGIYLYLYEWNYESNKISRRTVNANDPQILGYWNPYENN